MRNRPAPHKAGIAASLGFLAVVAATSCTGDVYRWQDERGRVHYGDRPAPGAERVEISAAPPNTAVAAKWLRVVRVHDGDTITLEDGERVRLLGINTPEVGGSRGLEAGGILARDWLRGKILGKKIRLEQDAVARDRYQRLLAHVFDESGLHINLELVRLGLATTDIFPPNLKYVDELAAAERQAEAEQRGLWALPEYRAKAMGSLAGARLEGWQRLTGRPLALAGGKNWKGLRFAGGFEVHVPYEDIKLFPPLTGYLGQTLEVRGWVSRRGGVKSILVRHPSALIVR